MADNFSITEGSGTIGAADDIGGVKFQRIKLTLGADGTNDGDVASGNPLPISGTVDLGATDNAVLDSIKSDTAALVIDAAASEVLLGTIDADTGAIATDIAALEVLQTTIAGDTTSIDGKITACDTTGLALEAGGNLADVKTAVEAINTKLVTGTVIGDVNLGATDNAVLDAIAADTGAIKTAVELIDNVVGSINGAGAPVIDSYTHAAINLAAGANQVLVSSAANKQIWVYGFGFTCNVAGTVSFQDEDDTAISGIMPIGITGGMIVSPSGNFAMPIWKLATDKDLEVDVVTAEIDGWLDYAIVSV